MNSSDTTIPGAVAAAVLQPSDPISSSAVSVQGPDFERSLTLDQFLRSYERIGFQANSLGKAISIVNKMVCRDYVLSIWYLTSFQAYMAPFAGTRNGR